MRQRANLISEQQLERVRGETMKQRDLTRELAAAEEEVVEELSRARKLSEDMEARELPALLLRPEQSLAETDGKLSVESLSEQLPNMAGKLPVSTEPARSAVVRMPAIEPVEDLAKRAPAPRDWIRCSVSSNVTTRSRCSWSISGCPGWVAPSFSLRR